jgi:hypothetical protein
MQDKVIITEHRQPKVDRRALAIADLPAPGTRRWVIRRKAEFVAAVEAGLVSLEEVRRRYTRSRSKSFYLGNIGSIANGLAGLRTTRIQQYRPDDCIGRIRAKKVR